MEEEFYRISRLPPYVFAEVNRMKAEARARGEDIIDLGMGNPDSATPQHIVDKLLEAIKNPETHGYSMSRGIPGLRKALVGYYQKRFGVTLDANKEVVVTIGSKEGLVNLAMAITKPGDVVIVPDPNYPIHTYGFILAGASVWSVPNIVNGKGLVNQIQRAIEQCSPKPLALVVNFPGNPTAEVVGLDFYEEVVAICKQYGVYVISDLAYAEIYFDEANPPPSILQIKGAKDIAIEFTTMSKTYSMAGWRVGFGAGNPKLVSALTHIKSYTDYGAFTPIQVASTAALNGSQDCVKGFRALYKERRDVLVEGLKAAGWEVPVPSASMFIWAPLPPKYQGMSSLEFSKLLLEHAKVAVAPGIGFGQNGEGFVRIALVENKHRIRQACKNIRKFLQEAA